VPRLSSPPVAAEEPTTATVLDLLPTLLSIFDFVFLLIVVFSTFFFTFTTY
jgi:hypothetical protein